MERLKRVREHLTGGTFCFTYGDGVSDVNIRALVDFHREQKALATLTATQPPGRFGALTLAAPRHTSAVSTKSRAAMARGSTEGSSSSSRRRSIR